MMNNLHLDILPEEQLRLFETMSSQSFITDFYLAGGTCLALQIGHRRSLAGLKDIAAMKLEAIVGRGSKKDFIDLYFLLQQYTLEEIFSFHALKYGIGLSNQYHHLKSLVYFADAEAEAMPVMITPLDWNFVKNQIISFAKSFHLGE